VQLVSCHRNWQREKPYRQKLCYEENTKKINILQFLQFLKFILLPARVCARACRGTNLQTYKTAKTATI
jgi:hypothetical protein